MQARNRWTRVTKRGELQTIQGSDEDLRAMKRALENAPLGPKATLALTSAIIALEEDDSLLDDSVEPGPPGTP